MQGLSELGQTTFSDPDRTINEMYRSIGQYDGTARTEEAFLVEQGPFAGLIRKVTVVHKHSEYGECEQLRRQNRHYQVLNDEKDKQVELASAMGGIGMVCVVVLIIAFLKLLLW